MKELIVAAKIENLDRVQAFVRAALADCPRKIQNQIAISVDEIFNNIASYAYANEIGDATVRVMAGSDIRIEFEDAGIPYNPLSKDDPDTSLDADDREIGGLGIFMVKNLMDSVEYIRKDHKNVLIIQKNLLQEG